MRKNQRSQAQIKGNATSRAKEIIELDQNNEQSNKSLSLKTSAQVSILGDIGLKK